MIEKVKDYIKFKGKNELNLLFNEWNESSLNDLENFAMQLAKIDLNNDDKTTYEFIDQLTFKTNKTELLKSLFSNEERTKDDLIELFVHCENINEVIKMELDYFAFGTILDNNIIIQLENEEYLIENNLLKIMR